MTHVTKPAGPAMLDTIGDLVVINLPSRQDRRRDFTQQLTRIGLSETDSRVRFFDAIRPDDAGPFRTIGARGCFLSHRGILRQACANGAERILICEDDLNFSSDFNLRAPAVMEALADRDWDIFFGFPPEQTAEQTQGLISIPAEQPVLCAHFLALRQPALEALVPYLDRMLARPSGDPAGGPMDVDGAYSWFRREHPQIRTFAASPALGYQRSSKTDISEPGLKDRLPIIRSVTRSLRQLKNRLSSA